MPDIDVPYVSQGDEDLGCVPATVKMLVEFYSAKYPDLPNPQIGVIKKAMNYRMDDGVSLDGVVGVNRVLVGSSHRLDFEWIDFAEFRDITEALDSGNPIIAWMKPDKDDEYSHSVVIKGRTEDDLELKVNDPDPATTGGNRKTSDFMREWTNSDRILIRAKVTERPHQRELTDYP